MHSHDGINTSFLYYGGFGSSFAMNYEDTDTLKEGSRRGFIEGRVYFSFFVYNIFLIQEVCIPRPVKIIFIILIFNFYVKTKILLELY
jgi:hypothetical protein